ncbi:hypothetical protein ALC56_10923 [Trachymyrmex septentrionalis]|uniref:Uncharacterized protein n=1 Tax=Trachymyrmex septentrionalis TaxID=34720 RepID=A0A195F228_9HYME|nr:hypothetical protein ALC56_10923 [Trachymyrmex septentrionalis]
MQSRSLGLRFTYDAHDVLFYPLIFSHVSFYPLIISKQRGQTIHHAYHTLASSNPQTDDPTILTAETRCDGKLWRAGGWPVHRVRALVKTNLSIAKEREREREKTEREKEINSGRETGARRNESKEPTEPVYREELSESAVYAAARRDSSLLGVYGRRVSQKHGINRQNDTESLSELYSNIIHSLSPF